MSNTFGFQKGDKVIFKYPQVIKEMGLGDETATFKPEDGWVWTVEEVHKTTIDINIDHPQWGPSGTRSRRPSEIRVNNEDMYKITQADLLKLKKGEWRVNGDAWAARSSAGRADPAKKKTGGGKKRKSKKRHSKKRHSKKRHSKKRKSKTRRSR
jgi:hypothetical protein